MLPCSAKLINKPNFDGIFQAWKTSRPNDLEPDFTSVIKMDVPVNEFSFFQFELTAPIAVRELICSMRNHVVWARSSRVDDLNEWPLWEGLSREEIGDCAVLHEKMQAEMQSKHQDDFRRHLPLGYMATFSFGMSFRELVKFINALFREKEKIKTLVFDDVAYALLLAVANKSRKIGHTFSDEGFHEILLNAALSYEWYNPHQLFPAFQPSDDALIGSFASISLQTTLQLRSQLIRHRALQFRDNFAVFFEPGGLACPMSSAIEMQVVLPMDFAVSLTRSRSCWIADTKLWKQMIEKLQALLGNGDVLLPCYDGKCRFQRDNGLRREAKDPAPPCPKAAILEGIPLTFKQSCDALAYSQQRPNFDFWKKDIENG